MSLRHAGLVALGALLLSAVPVAAQAQAQDADGDLVPDSLDNCVDLANGPNEASNQVDTDQDGFGNRCDPDVNNDGLIAGKDYSILINSFGDTDPLTDFDGDGVKSGSDYGILVNFMNLPPGPSGLSCADPLIDVDMGDPPCTP